MNNIKFIQIPEICPICGEPVSVVKENDSEVLMCMNAGCKGKLLGELNAFVGKRPMILMDYLRPHCSY